MFGMGCSNKAVKSFVHGEFVAESHVPVKFLNLLDFFLVKWDSCILRDAERSPESRVHLVGAEAQAAGAARAQSRAARGPLWRLSRLLLLVVRGPALPQLCLP